MAVLTVFAPLRFALAAVTAPSQSVDVAVRVAILDR